MYGLVIMHGFAVWLEGMLCERAHVSLMEAKPLQHVLNLLKDHRATTSAQRATSESTLVKLEELRATTMAHCTTSESQLVKLDGIIDLVNSAIKESPTDDEAFQEPPACYSRKPGAPPLEGAGRFYLVVHPLGGREIWQAYTALWLHTHKPLRKRIHFRTIRKRGCNGTAAAARATLFACVTLVKGELRGQRSTMCLCHVTIAEAGCQS